jgi:hypothetical protein
MFFVRLPDDAVSRLGSSVSLVSEESSPLARRKRVGWRKVGARKLTAIEKGRPRVLMFSIFG